MGTSRGEFGSRIGFIFAAAGSAVGLGNIWGFPSFAASNGGGAFLITYLLLSFLLAYPVLMAELILGRHAKANIISALAGISQKQWQKHIGFVVGVLGTLTAMLILSFYAIVAGWVIAFALEPFANLIGLNELALWFTEFSTGRNIIFMLAFMFLTMLIISQGVQEGIEKWSTRLMPALIIILLLLLIYVFFQEGALKGVKVYLIPDFSRLADIDLIISALGAAFFSLSLGVGTMVIYGSYIAKDENIVSLGFTVTLLDVGIAVLAGLLIMPAMYVAAENGVSIFNEAGALIKEDQLIFSVLPALFDTMGVTGVFIAFAFFVLMTIAALTSSISMLEVPVAYAVENLSIQRNKAAWLVGSVISIASLIIALNFGKLFGLVITVTTQYAQPLLSLVMCLFVGWVWYRNSLLNEVKAGFKKVEEGLFWKVWPNYVRFICPLIIVVVFLKSL